jgi:hypothetical protein
MRDFLWTVIGVWFVYKIYTEVIQPLIYRSRSQQNATSNHTNATNSRQEKPKSNEDKKKSLDGLGDYVDYEEIKD